MQALFFFGIEQAVAVHKIKPTVCFGSGTFGYG
jgi:hypothetical protein